MEYHQKPPIRKNWDISSHQDGPTHSQGFMLSNAYTLFIWGMFEHGVDQVLCL
jgi:hypothetical protein